MSTSSSKPRKVPPPAESSRNHPYARFIPREELSSFAAWALGDITASPGAANAPQHARRAADKAPPVDPAELALHDVDGLVGTDGQMSTQ